LDDREEHFDRKVLSPTVNVFDGNTNTDVLKGNSLSEASATASTKKGFYFRTTTESRINHLVLKVERHLKLNFTPILSNEFLLVFV
jgi:hypothetical protein